MSSSALPHRITIPYDECAVKRVTVYSDRAEVTRLVRANIDAPGHYDIIVENLSSTTDENSIRVGGGVGRATILEVSYHVIQKKLSEDPSALAEKTRFQESLLAERSRLQEQLARIEKQRVWLDGRAEHLMKYDGGGGAGGDGGGETKIASSSSSSSPSPSASSSCYDPFSMASMQSVEAFMEFYEKSTAKFDEKRAILLDSMKLLNERILSSTSDKNQYSATRREVTLSILAADKGQLELEVSYVVSNCSWSPSYDLRVNSDSGRTSLTYYGSIVNSSGDGWNDASLCLSTATLSLGGSPPALETKHVAAYDKERDYSRTGSINRMLSKGRPMSAASNPLYVFQTSSSSMSATSNSIYHELSPKDEDIPPPPVSVLTATSTSGISSTLFNIQRVATIEADSRPHKVTIAHLEMNARFTHSIVAKLAPHAYLKASFTNPSQDMPLLPGPINAFMDHNFIAQSQLEAVQPGEDFAAFLGVDASVRVEYKPVKTMNEAKAHGIIFSKNTEIFKFATVVKNTKASPIAIVVYDQLPLSSTGDVKVRLITPAMVVSSSSSDGTKEKEVEIDGFNLRLNSKNNLEWRTHLEANAEIIIPLEYAVEWPKDKRVSYN
eukprot:TRINITY_DN7664_c0_g2_i1.p1 TRINITY_DN7664_c0_g2~~TRINITY_DN7664_c0_g2_i1.p1  ORF type:complete len:623 (+),score=113.14 TRINITY_DN7664_c0_g2_i1:42-1871(+)